MISTSTYNNPHIKVENLDIIFNADFHRSDSMRDVFIKSIKNPLHLFKKQMEQLHVLKDISFTAKPGERIGIIGINGSGKTTLCRCISETFIPSHGTVDTQGEIRAIFEPSVGVDIELTGRENAKLLAALMFPNIKDHSAIIEESISFSELGHFIDMPIKKYSKGMAVRLFLSLISSVPSEILILDEIFDGADQFFQKKVAKRVLNIIENSGIVLFVSHSTDQVKNVCNRLILLHHGKIEFDGNVDDGINHYLKLNSKVSFNE